MSRNIHCKEDLILVFPEMKLSGPVPYSYINVSVWDLDIPMIGPPVLLQQIGGPIVYMKFANCRSFPERKKNSLGIDF
jgi:hypothetical protein